MGWPNSISEFVYDPEANVTFDTLFRRYEGLFRVDLSDKDDAWKVRLLLRKLGAAEPDKYCNLILPQIVPSMPQFNPSASCLVIIVHSSTLGIDVSNWSCTSPTTS